MQEQVAQQQQEIEKYGSLMDNFGQVIETLNRERQQMHETNQRLESQLNP